MCNVPCSMCGDYDGCDKRKNKLLTFNVIKNNNVICYLICTREEAETYTLFHPDITLITNNLIWDNEINDDLLN